VYRHYSTYFLKPCNLLKRFGFIAKVTIHFNPDLVCALPITEVQTFLLHNTVDIVRSTGTFGICYPSDITQMVQLVGKVPIMSDDSDMNKPPAITTTATFTTKVAGQMNYSLCIVTIPFCHESTTHFNSRGFMTTQAGYTNLQLPTK
jgi:hypothetical protein